MEWMRGFKGSNMGRYVCGILLFKSKYVLIVYLSCSFVHALGD